MGLIESLKSAAFLTESAMPKEEPIKKQALLFPALLICAILSASASDDSSFPSGVGYWQTRIGDHCFYNPTDAYYDT